MDKQNKSFRFLLLTILGVFLLISEPDLRFKLSSRLRKTFNVIGRKE